MHRLRAGCVELEDEVADGDLLEPRAHEPEEEREWNDEASNERREEHHVGLGAGEASHEEIDRRCPGERERGGEYGTQHASAARTPAQPPRADDDYPGSRVDPPDHVASRRERGVDSRRVPDRECVCRAG